MTTLRLCVVQASHLNIFSGHPSEDYQLPYFEKVQADPSIEEMKETVCVEKFRPTISKTWDTNEVIIF